MMNEKHLNWCKLHDWGGENSSLENGKIIIIDWRDNDKRIVFSSFSGLKAWAGY